MMHASRSKARGGLAALVVLAFVAAPACYRGPEPPNVPGPTVAHALRVEAPDPAPNAPKLVSLRIPDSKIVTFRVVFAAGSADDPQGKEGITELAATLLTDGGTAKLTYPEMVRVLYPTAATIEASVDRDETMFTAEVPRAALDTFYPVFRDVLLTPRVDAPDTEATFTRLRAEQTSRLVDDLENGDDETLGKEALHALLYAGHPYGHPAVGTESGLASITLADVRAHARKVFCKERVEVGIAGGFDAGFDQAVERDIVNGLPPCASARAELPPPPALHGMKVLVVDKAGADATAISLGAPTALTRSSPDYPAVAFYTNVLGLHRDSSGRLYDELRTRRGLNYGDYAYAEWFKQEGYSRRASANVVRRQQLISEWLRPVKPKNGLFALRAALWTTAKTRADLSSGALPIAPARAFLTRFIGLSEQTQYRKLGDALDDLAYGLTAPYLDTLRDGWARLDKEALAAALAKWLPTKDLGVAFVAKDGAALAAALAKGAASPPTYDGPKPPEVVAEDKEIQSYALGLTAADVKVVAVRDLFK